MVIFVWLVVRSAMREESRSVSVTPGYQSVTIYITGMCWTRQWFVDDWLGYKTLVRSSQADFFWTPEMWSLLALHIYTCIACNLIDHWELSTWYPLLQGLQQLKMFTIYIMEDHQLGLHTLLSPLALDWRTCYWVAPTHLPPVAVLLEFDVTVNIMTELLLYLYWCSQLINSCTTAESNSPLYLQLQSTVAVLKGEYVFPVGRVEVCYNQVWLAVDDYYWDIKDATVLCRHLHYPSNCKH